MGTKGNRSNGARKRRASRGQGRLYKRAPGGREYPADSPANFPFWLAYSIPNRDGGRGKQLRQALHDADGNPITDGTAAEAERRRILAPFAARDAAEAQRQLVARLDTAEAAVVAADDAANPPLKIAAAAAAYRVSERRPDSGPVTLGRYFAQWNRFSGWAASAGIVFMRDVTRDHVKAYVADLGTAAFSASTFNQHVDTLARFWKVLADEARVTANPWGEVRHKTIDKIERRKRALTLDEASKVIETAEPGDMRDLLVLVACTGQRLGDVCRLRWASVDLAAGIIELVPAKTRRRKGESVFIPILPQARAVLESRLGRKGYVLPVMAERYERDSASVSKVIQATFERAGIQTTRENSGGRAIVEYGAHSMRHCFVTLARWAGLPDALIQKITGHSSAKMTDHYSQFDKAIVSRLSHGFAALQTGGGGALALPAHDATPPHREPLPPWARDLVESLTTRNVRVVKAELLAR
jgi:integrase